MIEVKKELKEEYKKCSIKCLHIDTEHFPMASILLSFASKFSMMKNSKVFHSVWSSTMEKAKDKCPNMSIKDIESQVWIPTIEDCHKLLTELENLTVTLTTVNSLFKHCNDHELTKELNQLFCGIYKMECFKQPLSNDRIQHVVHHIITYRKLCRYCNAAKVFVCLREKLKLTNGDFKDLERISVSSLNR